MKTTTRHCIHCQQPIRYDDDEDRIIWPPGDCDCVPNCPEHGDALVVACPECQKVAYEAGFTIGELNGGFC